MIHQSGQNKIQEITPGVSETEIQKILDSREAINKNNYRNKLLRDVEQSENDRLQRQEASKDTVQFHPELYFLIRFCSF